MDKTRNNPHAVALGKLGGQAGGWLKWFNSLSPEARKAHQRKAGMARWERERERMRESEAKS